MSERQLLFLLSAEQARAYARLVEAAGRGDGDAACRLGDLYREGVAGIRHSPKQAFHWYARSAMAGDANGQNNLGACYEHGLGCAQSYARAVKWYRRSSARGLGTASMNLGYCHLRGHGVPANREDALRLFRLAVEQGDERARPEVERLAPAAPSVPETAAEARTRSVIRYVPTTEFGQHIGFVGIGGVAPAVVAARSGGPAPRCYDRPMSNQGSDRKPGLSIDDVRREERGSSGGRWVAILDGHEAEMTYSRASAVLIIIDHTAVPDALRGRGVGQVLVQRAVEDARREGFKILPLCPFAKGQFERHPEWRDVL